MLDKGRVFCYDGDNTTGKGEDGMDRPVTIQEERLTAEAYIDFLKRTM